MTTPKKPVLHLSEQGAEFIARWEGMRLHPYNDPVGFATIGIGHLLHRSPVTKRDLEKYAHFTAKDAYALLRQDAEHAAAAVRAIHPPITSQARFDALVSLAFNLGPGILGPSHTIGAAVRAPGRRGAADAFLLYDKAGGHRLAGLSHRRAAERKLWVTGKYI